MKIKKYFADSIPEAISEVRKELGEDAIIISTFDSERKRGAHVTAAIEDYEFNQYLHDNIKNEEKNLSSNDLFSDTLQFHGINENTKNTLIKSSSKIFHNDIPMKLAGAIDENFKFDKIKPKEGVPFFVSGPPGSGKTTVIARIATNCILMKKKVIVITTDTIKAGACEQLKSLTNVLGITLKIAKNPDELQEIIPNIKDSIILIDTPAVNYLCENEINDLTDFTKGIEADILLVLSALTNPIEAKDITQRFLKFGVKYLHITHTDCTQRLGSILSPPLGKEMAICDVSNTPFIMDSIKPLNPVSLARVLIETSNNHKSALRSEIL